MTPIGDAPQNTFRQGGFPLIAVDIGNTRTKLGFFSHPPAPGTFPEPERTLTLDAGWGDKTLADWLAAGPADCAWLIASVNRPSAARLDEFLHARSTATWRLEASDLPLQVAVERPDHVGVDRLVGAVAVNALRNPKRAAIFVDIGSAMTVDLVSAEGAFLGGSILPGIGMSAKALHEQTDLLPLVDARSLTTPPDPLGRSTLPAIEAGLFWGAVGAVRELASRLRERAPNAELFLTGGAAAAIAGLVASDEAPARYVAHLTLGGVALTAAARNLGKA